MLLWPVRSLLLVAVAVLFLSTAYAQPFVEAGQCGPSFLDNPQWSSQSLLAPPKGLRLYRIKPDILSEKQLRAVSAFGLTGTRLYPGVWGLRREDSFTDSAGPLVRPFFLRVSELQNYRAETMHLKFHFAASDSASPSPPVFEVRFGGRYLPGAKRDEPRIDEGYVLRLSAAEDFESGLFFRVRSSYRRIVLLPEPLLEAPFSYQALLRFGDDDVEVQVGAGAPVRAAVPFSNRGLISLLADLRPVIIEQLEIRGKENTAARPCSVSGLVGPVEHAGER